METAWKEIFGPLKRVVPIVVEVLREMDASRPGVHSQSTLNRTLASRLQREKNSLSWDTADDYAQNIVAHIHSQWSKRAGLGPNAKSAKDPAPILPDPAWLESFTAEWQRRPGRGDKWDILRRGPVVRPALFINGVFESTLADVESVQKSSPGTICYLQPYASERIKLLAETVPTPENPVTLYMSLTGSLPLVSYRAKIVGWQDKREIANDELVRLNKHIKKYQPSEEGVYLTVGEDKLCVNLISVIDVERFASPIPVSCFIKLSDGKPLGKRNRSGGWSVVNESPEPLFLTELDDLEAQLEIQVQRSSKDSPSAREQRLAAANEYPKSIPVRSRAFVRNPDVIAVVRERANGMCEECHRPAPFLRAKDNEPYLEVHHRIPLSQRGKDTVANAVALCPNCHRKLHFGKD